MADTPEDIAREIMDGVTHFLKFYTIREITAALTRERERAEAAEAKAAHLENVWVWDGERGPGEIAQDILDAARGDASPGPREGDGWRTMENAPKDETPLLLWGRYWQDSQGWMEQPRIGNWETDRWRVWGPGASYSIRPVAWRLPPAPPAGAET